MMIDGEKIITAGKLKEILRCLSDDDMLVANRFGNLAVVNADAEYIGYIDFAEESLET